MSQHNLAHVYSNRESAICSTLQFVRDRETTRRSDEGSLSNLTASPSTRSPASLCCTTSTRLECSRRSWTTLSLASLRSSTWCTSSCEWLLQRPFREAHSLPSSAGDRAVRDRAVDTLVPSSCFAHVAGLVPVGFSPKTLATVTSRMSCLIWLAQVCRATFRDLGREKPLGLRGGALPAPHPSHLLREFGQRLPRRRL